MTWHHRSSHTSRALRGMRSGFTLIELMVVCAVLVIVTMMAFSGFRYLTAVMNKTMAATNARENLSVVMDQMTKELREVTTVDDHLDTGVTNDGSPLTFGVTLPVVPTTVDVSRGIADVLSGSKLPGTTLLSGDTYTFNAATGGVANSIVLEFFTVDSSSPPARHRIRYSVTAPKVGSTYTGLGWTFWAVEADGTRKYEPCEVTYCNNRWIPTSPGIGSWSTELPQPMTDQVVTGFTVTRPLWSSKVVQITLEAQVRSMSGTGYSIVRLVGLVTVRQ